MIRRMKIALLCAMLLKQDLMLNNVRLRVGIAKTLNFGTRISKDLRVQISPSAP